MIKQQSLVQSPTSSKKIWTVSSNGLQERFDLVAVESPMEIRLGFAKVGERQQKSISVTMRTPGNDLELAMGFLFTEGIISQKEEILSIKHCEDQGKEESKGNVVRVELQAHCQVDLEKLQRHFYTTSSCGVCAKSSIEAIRNIHGATLSPRPHMIPAETIHQLSESLKAKQQIFTYTGGLHAAAFFDTSGQLLMLREDVGRHNALDKLIGASFYTQYPTSENILFLSGRISFELVQKALAAQVPIIVAVGAPSSLAVELAEESGITLLGFVRDRRFNLYTHPQRIEFSS